MLSYLQAINFLMCHTYSLPKCVGEVLLVINCHIKILKLRSKELKGDQYPVRGTSNSIASMHWSKLIQLTPSNSLDDIDNSLRKASKATCSLNTGQVARGRRHSTAKG